jgi:hypothetical protein
MATAVLFGLTVSTVLTLVIIPVMYSSLDSFLDGMRRIGGLVRRPFTRKKAASASDDGVGDDVVAAPAE